MNFLLALSLVASMLPITDLSLTSDIVQKPAMTDGWLIIHGGGTVMPDVELQDLSGNVLDHVDRPNPNELLGTTGFRGEVMLSLHEPG